MSVNEKMTAIADAIRDKTGGTDKLSLDEIAQAIPKVYEAGKEQGNYNEFWTSYMDGLTKAPKYHQMAFSSRGWNDTTFTPPRNQTYTFDNRVEFSFYRSGITDLKGILESRNTTFNFGGGYFNYFGFNADITRYPLIDMSKCVESNYAFNSCPKLKELTIKTSPATVFSRGCFAGATSLSNLTIGAHKKGKTCSELITLPFNEVFYGDLDSTIYINPTFAEKYSEYFNEELLDGIPYYTTNIAFETGDQYKCGTDHSPINVADNYGYCDGWKPTNESGNVSFYLCKNKEDLFTQESISQSISLVDSPLNKKSIICLFNALSSTVSGKTLTLKKSAVNEAFGIDVDDPSTWEVYGPEGAWFSTSAYCHLRHSKDNWTISYV